MGRGSLCEEGIEFSLRELPLVFNGRFGRFLRRSGLLRDERVEAGLRKIVLVFNGRRWSFGRGGRLPCDKLIQFTLRERSIFILCLGLRYFLRSRDFFGYRLLQRRCSLGEEHVQFCLRNVLLLFTRRRGVRRWCVNGRAAR